MNEEHTNLMKYSRYSRYIYDNELDKSCFQHDVLKIYQEERLLIKYYLTKHLLLLKIICV